MVFGCYSNCTIESAVGIEEARQRSSFSDWVRKYMFPSFFSDNESIECVEFPTPEHLSCNGDKQEESNKHIMQPTSTSKTINIKRDDFEEHENVPCGKIAIQVPALCSSLHVLAQPKQKVSRAAHQDIVEEPPSPTSSSSRSQNEQEVENEVSIAPADPIPPVVLM